MFNNDKRSLPDDGEVNLPPAADSICYPNHVVNSTESVFVIRIVNNQSQRVDVKTGRDANGLVEIYGNLNDGDILLVAATDEIKNGTVLQNVKNVTP
jgi:hypothetical protein